MKFRINSKDFKSYIDRVSSVLYKTAVAEEFMSISIKADAEKQDLTFSAAGGNSFVRIIAKNINVLEGGITNIDMEDAKKLFNVTGIDVAFTADDKKVNLYNGKKQCEIMSVDVSGIDGLIPNMMGVLSIEVDSTEFVDTLGRLSKTICKDSDRPSYHTYNIDTRMERIVSLDGFILGVKDFSQNPKWNIKNSVGSVLIPDTTYSELKKISDKKQGDLKIFVSNHHVFFEGSDFLYVSRKVDGSFIDIGQFINVRQSYSFRVDYTELYQVVKEYSGVLKPKKSRDDRKMFITSVDGKIVMAAISPNYKTSDVLETESDSELNVFGCFNPKLFKNILEVLEDGKIEASYENAVSPLILEQSDYTTLILPIRVSPEEKEEVMKFVKIK